LPGGPGLAQHRSLATALPGPASLALGERRAKAVARGVSPTMPVFAAAGGGGVIVDVDGNSLIDLGSGIAVTTVGIAHPEVVAAVQAEVASLTHTCFMATPYAGYVEVCEALIDRYPGNGDGKLELRGALFNSGAEAVENAVKIARAATGRQAVVAFDNAFHGRTSLTLAMTTKHKPYRDGFAPFAPEVYRMPGSYPYRDGLDGPAAAARAIDRIEKGIGAQNLAALVIEPIQGEGGFIVPAPGFLPALAAWCRAHGVVFVADEIQSGVARTGSLFAISHEGVVPDLMTSAKGLAGGLPLSAVCGRAELMDAPGPGGIGGTYGGNPVACAAALAVLRLVDAENLVARAQAVGAIVEARLAAVAARDPRLGEIRGRGAMIAVEIVDPDTKAPDAQTTARVADIARDRGVIVLTAGTAGNVLRFLPPLAIPDALLEEGLDVVAEAFRASRGV
jgi:4-aminobutyrate aminotransferase/(S)-3-amino-2-methylpropionate transaminase